MLTEISDVKNHLKNLNNVSLKEICREFIKRTEKNLVEKALENTRWNRKKAAILLNISYKSMLSKIKLYNIGSVSASVDTDKPDPLYKSAEICAPF